MHARINCILHDRNEKLPQVTRDIAWKAQLRLCARYRRLSAAGKAKAVVTTAIAREIAGSCEIGLFNEAPLDLLTDKIFISI